MQSHEKSEAEVDEQYQNFVERNQKDWYQLEVINVEGKMWIQELKCLKEKQALLKLDMKFVWHETVFNTNFKVACTKNVCGVRVQQSNFYQTARCQVFNADGSVLIFTKDFLLISKYRNAVVVPFVTQEAGIGYRGGRMVLSNPATLYYGRRGAMYISVHLPYLGETLVTDLVLFKLLPTSMMEIKLLLKSLH